MQGLIKMQPIFIIYKTPLCMRPRPDEGTLNKICEVQYEDDKKFIDRPVMFRLFLFFYLFPLRLSHELLTRNVKKWEIESFKLLSKMSNALKNMLKDGS